MFHLTSLHAQTSKVTGTVISEDKKPIEFANVILTADNSDKINGTISQTNGLFELKVIQNKYRLTVSILGYETHTSDIEVNGKDVDLGDIILKAGAQLLGEAVVTAKLVDRKADRFIMNINGNPTTVGKNSVELLAMAPSVWVDRQKGISINGKTDIKIMINDRIMNMSTDELFNYLETIPSEDIQSIEIITDPGAEYEANSNSGILHIKLKKSRVGGFTGSVSMNLQIMRDNPNYVPSFNLNYRRNKLSLYGSLYYRNGKWEGDGTTNTNFFDQNKEISSIENYNTKSSVLRMNLGMVYEITDKHEVGLIFETRNTPMYSHTMNRLSNTYINSIVDKKIHSLINNDWTMERYDASLNYKFKMDTIGSNLKVFFDYTSNNSSNDYYYDTFVNDSPVSDSTYHSYLPADYDIYAVRVDYLKKFNDKTSLSFGGRFGYAEMTYKSRHDDWINDSWVENTRFTDDYDYSEKIGALYAKFDSKLGSLSYTLGLRYENTSLNIAKEYKPSYNDLFPSVYLKYNLNEKKGHSVNAGYSRKLSRPYYIDLNPFKKWSDEFNYQVGNPYLEPTYSDAFTIGATLFDKFVLTTQYTRYNDVVGSITQAAPEPGVTMEISQNIDKKELYYASAYMPVKVMDWYNFTVQLSVSKNKYGSGVMSDQRWVYRGNTQHTFTLPKGWTISVDGWFSSKSSWSNSNIEISSIWGINGSINKKFFDNKLVASFNCWNIQGFRNADLIYKANNYLRKENVQNQSQVFNFTLTYKFSVGKKVEVKKAEKGQDEDRL
jgi:hypothetical protein